MDTTLTKDLADSLSSYSIDVKYWAPGMGDSFIFLGNRKFLAAHISELSPAQHRVLVEADTLVLAHAAKTYKDENDDDVQVLREVADIINAEPSRPGA